MQLTFISDTHSYHDTLTLGSGDILIHCGDFTRYGSLQDTKSFAQFMAAQDFTYKIVIAGNHDRCFENEEKAHAEKILKDHHLIYLNDSGITINHLKIWGSPIQPEYYNWAFNRDRGSDIQKHWQLIPNDTDVLLTHGPVFGRLDLAHRGENVGCEDLLATVQKIKPKIHACGHIHEAYGVKEKEGTIFVNASSLGIRHSKNIDPDNFPPNNPPIVLTI
ncbi:MAG: metallophosphatase domain-containing protein [Methylococcales bacterium]|nr:metallophosphatase domain-containing protein [Methylococcales bacterium]